MDLNRIGANRKEVRAVAFENRRPVISIDPNDGSIKLSIRQSDGMGAQGQYDYELRIDSVDINAILSALSRDQTAFRPGKLRETLEASLAPLSRLLIAATALPFIVPQTDSEIRLQALQQKLDARKKQKQ